MNINNQQKAELLRQEDIPSHDIISKDEITVNDLLTFGSKTMDKLDHVTKETENAFKISSSNKDLLSDLIQLMEDVDTGELDNVIKEKNIISKMIFKLSNKKDKLLKKYRSITLSVESSKKSVETWKDSLLKNTKKLVENRNVLFELQDDLIADREVCEYLRDNRFDTDTDNDRFNEMNQEKINLTNNNIQSINLSLLTCEQLQLSLQNQINTRKKIYEKLNFFYKNMLPLIKSVMMLIEAIDETDMLITNISSVNDNYERLLDYATDKSVEVSKRTVTEIGTRPEDFEFVQKNILKIKQGLSDVEELEHTRQESIINYLENTSATKLLERGDK